MRYQNIKVCVVRAALQLLQALPHLWSLIIAGKPDLVDANKCT